MLDEIELARLAALRKHGTKGYEPYRSQCRDLIAMIDKLTEEAKQLTHALDLQGQVLDHREIKMMEGMAMAHGCQYSDEFGALAEKAKVARGEGS